MYDSYVRIRLPATLSAQLKATAAKHFRSASDVIREAVVIRLDEMNRRSTSPVATDDAKTPRAA